MRTLFSVLLCVCALGQIPPGAWNPLYVATCGTPDTTPGQYFTLTKSAHGTSYESILHKGTCIFSPGIENMLFLAPCNATSIQQQWNWGHGIGGFIQGGGGCWLEVSGTPYGPAGDGMGLFHCGTGQGVFDLVVGRNNFTQIISNTSGMCVNPGF